MSEPKFHQLWTYSKTCSNINNLGENNINLSRYMITDVLHLSFCGKIGQNVDFSESARMQITRLGVDNIEVGGSSEAFSKSTGQNQFSIRCFT